MLGEYKIILTEYVKVTIVAKNRKHYLDLGYKGNYFDKIKVKVIDLPKQSNIKIEVKCDVCGKEKVIKYQQYMKSYINGNYYACCEKCASGKNKVTNIKRYGSESPLGDCQIQNKYKSTCFERYGVENYSKSEEFKHKYKEKMLNTYEVENGFQSEDIKRKSEITCLSKYGVKYNMQREEMKEQYLFGKHNPSYIDGTYYLRKGEWFTPQAKAFKKSIFNERKRECICCGDEKRKMILHHVYSRNTHPHLIFNSYNVVIMCEDCHKMFHNIYGYGSNNKLQFIEFLNNVSE